MTRVQSVTQHSGVSEQSMLCCEHHRTGLQSRWAGKATPVARLPRPFQVAVLRTRDKIPFKIVARIDSSTQPRSSPTAVNCASALPSPLLHRRLRTRLSPGFPFPHQPASPDRYRTRWATSTTKSSACTASSPASRAGYMPWRAGN